MADDGIPVAPGRSLLGRLLRGAILPMSGVALLLGLGGAVIIRQSVEVVNDRLLGAASRAIADALTVADGAVALNLSPAIFSMLEDVERDSVFYSVRQGKQAITGYPDLPTIVDRPLRDTEVVFGSGVYHGLPVRIVVEGRRIPGLAAPVTIEVAESMSARRHMERRLLVALATLEAALVGLGMLLLPIAMRWGMRPLIRLSAQMDQRLATDLTPLSPADAPVELRELIGAFNGMLQRLDTTLQRMRQFTADASHQLRTPLTILATHIAVLRQSGGRSDPEAAASLDDIEKASERLQRLVTQLLTLARADNAALAPQDFCVVDANRLAADVAADHAPGAMRRGIAVQFTQAPLYAPIRTHPLLAGEMVGNLIDNAIAYNREGGSVQVVVAPRPDGQVDMLIEDDGPGIPIADRARVLTRFSRLPRDTVRLGSGLGLSIADALARAIGAGLVLETARDGHGLLARITFPGEPADSGVTGSPF